MNSSLKSSTDINNIDSCGKEIGSTSCTCPSTGSIHWLVSIIMGIKLSDKDVNEVRYPSPRDLDIARLLDHQ